MKNNTKIGFKMKELKTKENQIVFKKIFITLNISLIKHLIIIYNLWFVS